MTGVRRTQAGVTAIEYALVAALISVAIVLGAGATGVGVAELFQAVGDAIKAVASSI